MHCKGRKKHSTCVQWYCDVYLPLSQREVQAALHAQANRLEAESLAQDRILVDTNLRKHGLSSLRVELR
jgi:hypothetical protein